MATNAATYISGLSTQTATQTTATTVAHNSTTDPALRTSSIRRSVDRSAGAAIPLRCNRSVGSTSGRADGSDTIVCGPVGGLCATMPVYYAPRSDGSIA